MKVKLDTKSIELISIFHDMTGCHVIDCAEDGELYFVVAENEYGIAVGKDGKKIRFIENKLGKHIKVFEFAPNAEKFIRNIISEVQDIVINDKSIEIKVKPADKPKVVGKGGKNVKIIGTFLNRLFGIESFKVK